MGKLIQALLIGVILFGCGENKPLPSARLEQPTGSFSFVTPDGWFGKKVGGVDFIIVAAQPDYGFNPNIFVDFVSYSTDLTNALSKQASIYDHHLDYEVLEKADFTTESGLQGIKLTAHRKTKNKLPLATYQYLIEGTNRVFSITCSCADAVKEKYEPIFDYTMRTLNAN